MKAIEYIVKKRTDIKKGLFGFGYFALGFGLSLTPCGYSYGRIYPLGTALVCGTEKYLFPAFLGAFVSGLFDGRNGVFRMVAVMTAFGLRWAISKSKTGNKVKVLKVLTTIAVTLISVLWEMSERNAVFESVAGALFAFSLLPLFAFLFSESVSYSGKSKAKRDTAVFAWSFAAVLSVSTVSGIVFPESVHIAIIPAGILTLCYAREGYLTGGLCGFFTGCAVGIIYSPVFATLGLIYGVFAEERLSYPDKYTLSPRVSLAAASFISIGACMYLTEPPSELYDLIFLSAGIFIFAVICKKLRKPLYVISPRREKDTPIRMMSSAFSALAEAFYTDNSVPDDKDIILAVRKTLFSECGRCAYSGGCKVNRKRFEYYLTDLAFDNNPAEPEAVKKECVLFDGISAKCESVKRVRERENLKEARLLTEGYNALAKLLDSAGIRAEEENRKQTAETKKAENALKSLGLKTKFVSVKGKRSHDLRAGFASISEISASAEEIRKTVSEFLGTPMSPPEFTVLSNGVEMHMRALPVFRIEYAKAESSKTGESVSGDTSVMFENNRVFYSLLADGMGSGKDASASSRLAALFVEKLITAGGNKTEVLRMLNELMLSRKEEVYTTVDLLEIDCLSGVCSITKAGAAPTYICRNGKCGKVDAGSTPVGVIREMKISETDFRLKRGDMVVMISDGVIAGDGKIEIPEGKTASRTASEIIEKRRELCFEDDMSVCVIRAL